LTRQVFAGKKRAMKFFLDLTALIIFCFIPFGCGSSGVSFDKNIGGNVPAPSASSTVTTPACASTNTCHVVLHWDAPATSEDPITGYELYWGVESGVYTDSGDAGNNTTYTTQILPAGTYYFIVKAYDAEGIQSKPSNEAVVGLSGTHSVDKEMVVAVP
jgi:hypothetical protein